MTPANPDALADARKLIPLTQPETAALIRLSGRRPLQLAFGTGWTALDPARSPWAVPLLERMRSLVLEDGAGI